MAEISNNNVKKEKFINKFMIYYASGVTFISFVYIFCITFIPLPKDNQRFADVILGFLLGSLIGSILQYYFGSSATSKDKDETISKIINREETV